MSSRLYMEYRREIDGLRALAVLPVMLFHAGIQTFSGGFVGVDVFFVISGYLITSIIMSEKSTGTFTLGTFYERRARRILPALFLVMFACIPFAWIWLLPYDMKSFSQSLIAVSSFASNFLFWRTSGYFENNVDLKPLLHTWSLAVEMQFYLLFPVFLLLIWKFGKRWMVFLLAVTLLLSLAAAQLTSISSQPFAFFMLPTRGWELLIGALVAMYKPNIAGERDIQSVSQLLSIAGLLLIGYAVFAFDKQTRYPSLFTLVPTIGTALVLFFASGRTVVGKVLGGRLLVSMGIVSYSAYLWHQPLFAFAKHGSLNEPHKVMFVVLAAISFILAFYSWKYVESPFRNKQRFNRKYIISYCIISVVIFSIFGMAGHFSNGFETRFHSSLRDVINFNSYVTKDIYRDGVCFLRPEQSEREFGKECDSDAKSEINVIWGDSHAAALSFGLRNNFKNVAQYTASSCPPILDAVVSWSPKCKSVNDFVAKQVGLLKPTNVFLHANWITYTELRPAVDLQRTIDYIKKVSPRSTIFIVGGVPQYWPSLPKYMVKMNIGLKSGQFVAIPVADTDETNILEESLARLAEDAHVVYFSSIGSFCLKDKCQATAAYEEVLMPVAWDYGHLTAAGSYFLANKLYEKVCGSGVTSNVLVPQRGLVHTDRRGR